MAAEEHTLDVKKLKVESVCGDWCSDACWYTSVNLPIPLYSSCEIGGARLLFAEIFRVEHCRLFSKVSSRSTIRVAGSQALRDTPFR